jgi:hypothetical protein
MFGLVLDTLLEGALPLFLLLSPLVCGRWVC